MDTIEEQVGNFLSKCDDLMQSKFILAPSKISEVLRAIATAPALVALLEKATKPFDYIEAQKIYLLPSPDGTENKGILSLPEEPLERLAFIFCLLVDIDNQAINFNLFLQTFFAEDRSYTEAFDLFTSQVIRPLKTVVTEELMPKPVQPLRPQPTFNEMTAPISDSRSEPQRPLQPQAPIQSAPSVQPEIIEKKQEKHTKHNKKAVYNAMLPIIKAEIAAVQASTLSEPDRYAGVTILDEIHEAAKANNEKAMKALLFGYNYFIVYTGANDANALKMFNLAEEL